MPIELAERLGIHIKKAPFNGAFLKWCEILCNYRTENYDEFKQLTKKIELFEDIYKQNTSELLVII